MHRDLLATDDYRERTHGGSKMVEGLQTLEIIPKTFVRVLLAEETISSRWYWRLQPMTAVLLRSCPNNQRLTCTSERAVECASAASRDHEVRGFPFSLSTKFSAFFPYAQLMTYLAGIISDGADTSPTGRDRIYS